MVYELQNTERAAALFAGWQETMLLSCLQGIMGKIMVADTEAPVSAFAEVGCFSFYAGRNRETCARCLFLRVSPLHKTGVCFLTRAFFR